MLGDHDEDVDVLATVAQHQSGQLRLVRALGIEHAVHWIGDVVPEVGGDFH